MIRYPHTEFETDITIFHSSELDDPRLLPEGFYVGAFPPGSTAVDIETAKGPYPTRIDAASALLEMVRL